MIGGFGDANLANIRWMGGYWWDDYWSDEYSSDQ